ncbi:Dcm Site-specific DNA methylase [uncultured Caudovirales phage]|uniref:Cytosine-specific methyltransferase n=1 Tax=uncultured Caudovirales phage TaxID=2100421 RepID=A0A6J7XPR6_9CAUD|nr:Dcm Site-specific DNA methylase [uncultured Caudovirales phage]
MNYLSVCSGIEAASVAWHDLGFTPIGFAEIEPFPSAVLKERFPNVPNYGDITQYKQWGIEPGTVDILVGGPPCQAFSVAGLREGMADPRGNLSLTYVGMVDHFKPKWLIYENVPGLLSSNGGKDFSALTGALAVIGYSFSYRILNAEFFGVPQRRRRIFLVGHRSGDWRHPAAVLFDGKSVFGNPTQKPKSWQGIAPTSGTGAESESGTVTFGTKQNPEIANTIQTTCHDYSRADGFNMVGEPQKPIAFKTRTGGEYSGTKGGEIRPNEKGGTGMLSYEDKTFTIATTQDQYIATPISYSIREDAKADTFSVTQDDVALCVTKVRPSPQSYHAQNFVLQPNQVMFRKSKRASSETDHETWVADDKSNTLNNFDVGDVRTTHAVVYENHPNDSRVTGPHEVAPTVTSRFGTGGGNVPFVQETEAVAFQPGNLACRAGSDPSTEVFPTLSKDSGDQNPHVATPMAVRRLTPNECLALQGFPKDWTKISWKGKPPEQCPDGPQYKAAGNSMAVPCMRFLGERIKLVEEVLAEVGNNK